MKVTHIDAGSMRPLGGGLIDGGRGVLRAARLVCHVLVVETEAGLVLVDTGIGRDDLVRPPGSLPGVFVRTTRPVLDPATSAVERVKALGHDPADVRHIVLTHLDLDHAGGLRDFPDAVVHVRAEEHSVATAQRTSAARQRFRPAQWAHGPKFELYSGTSGEDWFGFGAVRPLTGLPEDILMVPLPGHTHGHTGVAVRGEGGWLLHAGDAYFHRSQARAGEAAMPAGLRAFERVVQTDATTRKANAARVRELAAAGEVEVFCAHDPVEFDRFA